MQSSTWSSTGRISTGGSIRPVGRMTCSAKTPPVRSISQPPGVAETWTVCGRIASHSSKRSGRLSMQLGRRKPYSASVDLRGSRRAPSRRSAARSGGFRRRRQRVVGQVFEQRRRRLAGQASGEEAANSSRCRRRSRWRRSSRGRNWCAARAAAPPAACLRLEKREAHGQLEALMPSIACFSVGPGVT
jgi:hypothetical protein